MSQNEPYAPTGTSSHRWPWILLGVFIGCPIVLVTVLTLFRFTRSSMLQQPVPADIATLETPAAVARENEGQQHQPASLPDRVDATDRVSLPPDGLIIGREPPRMGTADEIPARNSAPLTGIPTRLPIVAGDDRDIAIDREARDLARRIRTAQPTEQATLRNELEQLTERHFQYRQERRKQELDELSQRIDKLRITYQRRQENKAEVIQRRLKELLDPNADLDWEQSPSRESAPGLTTNARGANAVADAVPENNPNVDRQPAGGRTQDGSAEPTFDTIPYSHWLQILATERQPARLASAMEACGRLAQPRDARSIARKIFIAAALFEEPAFDDIVNRSRVWSAGWAALKRLHTDVVVDELLVALRDQDSFKKGREFQGQFVVQQASQPIWNALAARCDEVIGQLVQVASENQKTSGWVLAAACTVWRQTDRPLSDFGKLPFLVDQMIDDGFTVQYSGFGQGDGDEIVRFEWRNVAGGVVLRAPETPDLALRLMKHAPKSREVLELVGKLGPHAEPAVPIIVDQFVTEWKKYEDGIRMEGKVGDSTAPHWRNPHDIQRNHLRLLQQIQTLGEIGVGAKGYALLRQLSLLYPSRETQDQFGKQVLDAADRALKKFKPAPEFEAVPFLLGDFWLLQGRWRLRLLAPGDTPKRYVATVFHKSIDFQDEANPDEPFTEKTNAWFDDLVSGVHFEFNESMVPKQTEWTFSRANPGVSRGARAVIRKGVYEVTQTTLRIQLAAEGKPAPMVIAKGRDDLPEGQVQMEFDREIPTILDAERDSLSPQQSATRPGAADSTSEATASRQTAGGGTQGKTAEPTYDGIPYSQWLNLLETERKPTRLAAAMEACGRLADPKDARVVVRRIFLAAGLFEEGGHSDHLRGFMGIPVEVLEGGDTAQQNDQSIVWMAAFNALNRLPTEAVVDGLLSALRDQDSFKTGRTFQTLYVALMASAPIRKMVAARSDEVIGRLVQVASQRPEHSTWALAAACSVWAGSNRPMNEFGKLASLVDQAIDNGFSDDDNDQEADAEWTHIAQWVVQRAPETPNLALRLMKQADQHQDSLNLVANMGRHAEPAVPLIVDQFLSEWNKYEGKVRANAMVVVENWQQEIQQSSFPRLIHLIKALGRIGVGPKGLELLRELQLIVPPRRHLQSDRLNKDLFDAVDQSLKEFASTPAAESTPRLLTDFTMIRGEWRLKALNQQRPTSNYYLSVDDLAVIRLERLDENGDIRYVPRIGDQDISGWFEMDSAAKPKRFSLYQIEVPAAAPVQSGHRFKEKPGSRREGLYELTNTTLWIQLAPNGKLAPTTIAKSRGELPEGHVLMEFEREMNKAIETDGARESRD